MMCTLKLKICGSNRRGLEMLITIACYVVGVIIGGFLGNWLFNLSVKKGWI